jgi:hypothetical protein
MPHNHQWLSWYFPFIIMTLLFLSCSHNIKPRTQDNPRIPAVLGYQFFTPETESGVIMRKYSNGQIFAVRTPIDRIQELNRLWDHDKFDAAIRKKSAVLNENDSGEYCPPYVEKDLHELFEGSRSIPTTKAWTVLKKYIRTSDKIWTFDGFDAGFAVLRDGHLYCLIWTDHSL